MATCSAIANFLDQVNRRSTIAPLAPGDLATLQQAGLVVVQDAAAFQALSAEVNQLAATRTAIWTSESRAAQLAEAVRSDQARTHSILFHLEGSAKQDAERARASQDTAALQAAQSEIAKESAQFNDLMQKSAILGALTPYAGGYVGITGSGAAALRDLQYRLYRVGDIEFAKYWAQSQDTLQQLESVAVTSAQIAAQLRPAVSEADPAYLWAIAIGLAKLPGAPADRESAFLESYRLLGTLSGNLENRLMTADLLASLDRPPAEQVSMLGPIVNEVRKAGVPKESALAAAAVILSGQRADGSLPIANLRPFLGMTHSYDAAALLCVVNRPMADVTGRFAAAKSIFLQAGYAPSEDLEVSSAYLAVSDLPLEGAAPKLSVLTKGLGSYLQYPLVGAAILSTIAGLEAGETLRLTETAYTILGRRTGPMAPAALICLAIRAIHGITIAGVDTLDPTAANRPSSVSLRYGGPRWFVVPLIVGHGGYYSTFGAFGGAHPGHVHAFGGAFIG